MALPDRPNIAIVGATGVVGRELLAVLASRAVPHAALHLLASSRSAGTTLEHGGRTVPVRALEGCVWAEIDLAFFCAGGAVSRAHAPAAVDAGAVVIDNSSAFRMEPQVPLVVPEINGHRLRDGQGPGIVANPNCSTIIALMAATPLHRAAGVRRMVVSTYQAASGAGSALMRELEQQARDFAADRPLTTEVAGRPYLFNVFSHDSAVGDDGYNEEERKLMRETRKIWEYDDVQVTATCVRVPVLRTHCEAINLSFDRPLEIDRARRLLDEAPGVRVVDDPATNTFPEPATATGGDDVLVGRIRSDISQPPGLGLDLFVAGDQLRKGAALNAVQIAEALMGKHEDAEVAASARTDSRLDDLASRRDL